ncbi:hypothetical protein EW145_g6858 [Phellinidium pouzarii]|uniref:Large ribosomal subunit protein mL44 n=1 Tax=Phellinidium pouzarii TaxID=167371 RepID=A0A4S4KT36_9AGAM|nr:hypothetical protein EW145_g6858 [Phellinidium pouzarii]
MAQAVKSLASRAAQIASTPASTLRQFPPKEAIFSATQPVHFSPEIWANLQKPPTSALAAFSHRIGLSKVVQSTDEIFQTCTHPTYPPFYATHNPAEAVLPSNANLSTFGNSLLGLFATEYLHASYPHLPLRALKAAVSAYVGPLTCATIAKEMGATPLLRWNQPDSISSVPNPVTLNDALATIPRALTALVYQKRSLPITRKFVQSYFLSRDIDLRQLIKFRDPKMALSRTVSKFKRERPVSRLLRETGRLSNSPTFVVGIYSGSEKLGEGFGSSLKMAEYRAAEDSLHRLYLTRTPKDMISLPTDTFSTQQGPVFETNEDADIYTPGEIGELEVIYASKDRDKSHAMASLVVEKQHFEPLLPTADAHVTCADVPRRRMKVLALCLSAAGFLVGINGLLKPYGFSCGDHINGISDDLVQGTAQSQALCPQVEQLLPDKNKVLWSELGEQFDSLNFKEKAINWLAGAVRVPTESYDLMDPVGIDPRWEKFGSFHDYLEKAFPLVHANLNLTKGGILVNTYGLLFEWVGSDPSLKPLLLAAHQDVVPVDPRTVDEWAYPPFSGFFDGKRIWGRGSSDDKSGLVGVMSAIETLLAAEFQPTRNVVLAFGFDEEVSGIYGAQQLGKYMEATYGEDAFAMLIDEGGGFSSQYGGVFAVPAVGEKGYLDTRVEVTSAGGHSSIPPPHTSIGILASLLVEYEAKPIPAVIDRTTPIYGMMQCLAKHAPDMDKKFRKTILNSASSDKALRKLEKTIAEDRMLKSFVGTTHAIDLIEGGVKTNALPEQAWAVVNHRIATQSSVAAIKEHDTKLLAKLAKSFNLTYNAFGLNLHNGRSGTLTLSDAFDTALDPAPITPTDSAAYKLLSGTIRATYNSARGFANNEEIQVAPGIMTGNTDTRYYWKLTQHIFRYNHHNLFSSGSIPGGVHTVNESIVVDDFLEMIRFFATLILNVDESNI